ncbi:hypothetical protein ABEB36_004345 [Hypothenemus hampei]|uniref:Probable proline--tRNA ligase, mitochondrial n=1 Tax=Hypothenemus hampei TaxID=57062 RepID=A0ABD1F662_HYPHA
MNRFSRIFQPIVAISKSANITNKDFMSKSQRLMLELGIIHQAIPGCFHFLPMGLRSINKIMNIVDEEMHKIGGQKIMFPTLVKAELWEKSGRENEMRPELIVLKDRHNQKYLLGPTHEETASNLIASLAPTSYKKYPLLLYQITSKFRDEMKPRFGLIRAREFLMKDMYSFDITSESALNTYNSICDSYDRVFQRIGVDFIKVQGDSGAMGGNFSHEYHYISNIGDDKILICLNCQYSTNVELIHEDKCPKCGETNNIHIKNAIEVGHTFLLGEKYSKPLQANYLDEQSKPQVLQMGSYGIGISRILGAALECLSLETELRWPDSIAPYHVVIIPPKKGSKQALQMQNLDEKLYRNLESHIPNLRNDITIDDRIELTIGRRILDCKRTGIRYLIVLNELSLKTPPIFEINDTVTGEQFNFSENELYAFFSDKEFAKQGAVL